MLSGLHLYGRRNGSLSGLDALRGIAVLLVLFRHAVRPFWRDASLLRIGDFDVGVVFINGWIGVDLFFVLSGFLITHHLLAIEDSGRPFQAGQYLMRRFLRIVPLYYVVLALTVLGAFPLYRISEQGIVARALQHMLFMQDYLGSDIVPAFWSLGVEEKFYLVAPALAGVALGVKSLKVRLLVCGVALAASLASRVAATSGLPLEISYEQYLAVFRYPFHHCADGLAIGMACALALPALKARWSTALCTRVGDLLIGASLVATIGWLASGERLQQITFWDETLQPTALALTFGAAVMGCALGSGAGAFLDKTFLRGMGRLSYPMYLAHMPLIPLSGFLAGASLWHGSEGFWSFLPVFLALTFIVSLALHHLVEKPFLIMKDRLGAPHPRLLEAAEAG